MNQLTDNQGKTKTADGGCEPEAKKSYQEILIQEIMQGMTEIDRPVSGLFLSGLSAGLDLGFSVFLMAVMITLTEGLVPHPIVKLLTANMYPIGFVLVIFGRSELFTEHTTLAVLPVLDRRKSLFSLLRLWIIIYFSNLLGACLFSLILAFVSPAIGDVTPEAFRQLAAGLVHHTGSTIFLSGILAGWLMGLLSWLVTAGRDTISQVLFVWLITFAIGLGGLHHSIAGSVEILPAVYLGLDVSLAQYLFTLLWMTLGNAAGGVIFVAIIKYSHVIRAQRR